MIEPARLREIDVVTFDCYGTLIDWESGILEALRPLANGASDERLLQLYASAEARLEAGPYLRYREVLARIVDELGRELGFSPDSAQRQALVESLPRWRPFPDTVEALRSLSRRFRLAVISNVDADLFEATDEALGRPFEWIITADKVGAYKPSPANFVKAGESIARSFNRILHAAQSVYHDIVPARLLGLSTARVDRASRRPGVGVAPEARAQADLEVKDLRSLAEALL